MASFFHDHEPITFMSKEIFYQQIFHHKLSNLMALFIYERESITFMSKEVFYEQIFHHELNNQIASFHEPKPITCRLMKFS